MSPDVLAPPAPERVSPGSVVDELEDRPRLLPSPRTPRPRRWLLVAVIGVALVVVIATSTLRLREGPITLGFGAKATGGAGGAVLRVTSLADGGPGSLRAAATTAAPATIHFDVSGVITLSQPIPVASDKTIDGGGQITLNRAPGWLGRGGLAGYLEVKGSRNVIIRGMKFIASGTDDDAPDAISIGQGASDVLVTHNTFEGGGKGVGDGAIDIVSGTNVTASWNHFRNWDKPMLINGLGPDGKTVISRPQVTVHHNYFDGTVQRNPKLRHGMVHAYNNYLRHWSGYGMGVEDGGQLASEGNIFEAGVDKRAIRAEPIGRDGAPGFARSRGDKLLGDAHIQTRSPEKVFQPSQFYGSIVEPPSLALRDRIIAGVGWRGNNW